MANSQEAKNERRPPLDHPGVEILIAVFGDGVGRLRALDILKCFGSVRAFDRASIRQRIKAPGIGRALARRWDERMELPFDKEES
jgi:ERCC4-type nuclease